MSGMPGFFIQAGLEMGIPLDRLRSWEFVLGPQFTFLMATEDARLQRALLFGARLALEGSTGGGGFGVSGGPFVSGGYGMFNSSDPAVPGDPREAWAPYAEIGGRFGIRSGIDSGARLNFGLEGAAGSALGAPGIIGPAGADIASDPERTHWFRVGLGLGGMF